MGKKKQKGRSGLKFTKMELLDWERHVWEEIVSLPGLRSYVWRHFLELPFDAAVFYVVLGKLLPYADEVYLISKEDTFRFEKPDGEGTDWIYPMTDGAALNLVHFWNNTIGRIWETYLYIRLPHNDLPPEPILSP